MVEVNESDFKNAIAEGLVLVDFWAPWCAPCRAMMPVLTKLEEAVGELKIVKVNIDENQNLASSHKLSAVPTLILFQNGEEVGRKVGAVSSIDVLTSFVKGEK